MHFMKPSMLNRSASLSEFPVSKQVTIEKRRFSATGQSLVKHYSCEQLICSSNKVVYERIVQELNQCDDQITNFKSCTLKFERPYSISSNDENTNFCDTQNNLLHLPEIEVKSVCKKGFEMDLSQSQTNPSKHGIRMLTTSSSAIPEKRNTSILFVFLPVIFVVTAIVASSTLYLASYRRYCEIQLDVSAMVSALQKNIYGQEQALNDIANILDSFNNLNDNEMIIMAFLGGTGIGKSYTTKFIKELFPWKDNIQHYVLPVNANDLSASDVHAKFSACGGNLVIIDALVPSEVVDVIKFLQTLKNLSRVDNKRSIIILIINSEEQKFILQNINGSEYQLEVGKKLLNKTFQSNGLKVKLIPFQGLKSEHIIMCIKEAFVQKEVVLSDPLLEQVLTLLPQNTGCKGVASKVQLVISSS